jgi:glycosyltransferase involved in cell wall biosynthesis
LKSITVKPSNANFSILHAGSLSVSKSSTWNRSPDTIFQAVRNILQDNPQFGGKICLAFTGSLPETQRQFIKEMGLSSAVKELGFLSYDDLIHLMKASAMLLTINYDGFITLIPGKIYEYWAVGGPPILLLSHPGAATSLVDKYSLGFSVDPTDIAGIEQAILTAFLQYQTGEPMRLSTTGIESFDRQALTCKLAQVLIMVR